jgi:hypothetical protein
VSGRTLPLKLILFFREQTFAIEKKKRKACDAALQKFA